MKKIISILFCALVLFNASSALAADPVGFQQGFNKVDAVRQAGGVKNFANISDLIREVLRVGLIVVPIIALVVVIGAGVMYITALGDEKKTEKAKMVILYTVVGLIIIGLAGIITNVVINLITP